MTATLVSRLSARRRLPRQIPEEGRRARPDPARPACLRELRALLDQHEVGGMVAAKPAHGFDLRQTHLRIRVPCTSG